MMNTTVKNGRETVKDDDEARSMHRREHDQEHGWNVKKPPSNCGCTKIIRACYIAVLTGNS